MNAIRCVVWALLLFSTSAAGSGASRWDAVHAAAQSSGGGDNTAQVVVRTVGDRTLFIPHGYVSSFLGYAGYVQIHALLPCLQPETPENKAEFHKSATGGVLTATLSEWDNRYRVGQQWLDTHVKNSEFVKSRDPSKRYLDTGPSNVPGTNFLLYKDILLQLDVFVLENSEPLFVLDCNLQSQFPFPNCSVSEKFVGSLRLQYSFDRSFVDTGINNSITIDTRLRRLLESFLTPMPDNVQTREGETCK
jgi:hypothetical protein